MHIYTYIYIYNTSAHSLWITFHLTSHATCKHHGLRTLCFASRSLSEEDYLAWLPAFRHAEAALENRDVEVEVCFRQLEKGLELQGVSGIVDELQEKVPETIQLLRQAGIKVSASRPFPSHA